MPAFLTKYLSPLVVTGLLFAAGGFLTAFAVHEVNSMVKDARDAATAERNAFWKGKIAEANAEKADAVAAQLRTVMLAGQQIRAAETAAEDKLRTMERANAALPGGDARGLSAERVRILPR